MITESDMMHGRPWNGQDLAGWHVSEKMDGCRGYWDGDRMWSRSGREIKLPAAWIAALPAGMHLDGEIWAGRGGFKIAARAMKYNRWVPGVRFVVFDAPLVSGDWLSRLAAARAATAHTVIECVEPRTVRDTTDANQLLAEVLAGGGEGLMVYFPAAQNYHAQRCEHVLKLKKAATGLAQKKTGVRITLGLAA